MLTIFTTCRPFEGEFDEIQQNAIRCWKTLEPRPEIILIGDDAGTAEAAVKHKVRHVPFVQRNRWNTPLLGSVFAVGLACASRGVACYVNADVLLDQGLVEAIKSVQKCVEVKRFLLVGPRWDLKGPYTGGFGPGWAERLRRDLERGIGRRHKPTGLDYFAFTLDAYDPAGFPPLAVGRTQWDSWLVWRARQSGVHIVDGTQAVLAVHQRHEKAKGGGDDKDEVMFNRALARERLGEGYVWDARLRVGPPPHYGAHPAPEVGGLWGESVGWVVG